MAGSAATHQEDQNSGMTRAGRITLHVSKEKILFLQFCVHLISGSGGDPVPAHTRNLPHSEPRPHAEQASPPALRLRP